MARGPVMNVADSCGQAPRGLGGGARAAPACAPTDSRTASTWTRLGLAFVHPDSPLVPPEPPGTQAARRWVPGRRRTPEARFGRVRAGCSGQELCVSAAHAAINTWCRCSAASAWSGACARMASGARGGPPPSLLCPQETPW